jgi:hypothetical protein
VHVLRRRHERASAGQIDADELPRVPFVHTVHARGSELAVAIARRDHISDKDRFDRLRRSVAHCDLRALDEALVGVAHDQEVPVLRRQHLDELPLGEVGVLELVDEHVQEPLLPAGEHIGVLAEQAHREHEQVVEVDGRRVEQAPLVLGVHLRERLLRRCHRLVGVRLGEHQLVLECGDARVQLARRIPLRVEVEVTAHVVGEAHGVGLVVDRERGPDADVLRLAPQDARARGVERRHPHAARHRPHE